MVLNVYFNNLILSLPTQWAIEKKVIELQLTQRSIPFLLSSCTLVSTPVNMIFSFEKLNVNVNGLFHRGYKIKKKYKF